MNTTDFLPVHIQIEIAVAGLWIGQAEPFPLPQRHQLVLIAQQLPLLKEFAKAINKLRYNDVNIGEPLFISIAIDAAAIPEQGDPASLDNGPCAKTGLNWGM